MNKTQKPPKTEPVADAPAKPKRVPKPKTSAAPKRQTNKSKVIEMLRSKEGVTLAALMVAFGVQEHSARAMVSVHGRAIGGVTYDKASKVYRAKV